MCKFRLIVVLVLAVMFSTAVNAELVFGTGTATGTVGRSTVTQARIRESEKELTGLSITRVVVLDIFGNPRVVEYTIIGGDGTAQPTIKFIGPKKLRPQKHEFVTIEFTMNEEGDVGPLDLQLF